MRRLGFTIVSMVLLLSSHARTEQRDLGGHTFLSSAATPWPFIGTTFSSSTGGGLFSIKMVGRDQDGAPLRRTLRLAAFGEGFALSVRALPWLSVNASVTGVVISGVDVEGALNVGATASYAFGGGASVRLLRSASSLLTLRGDARGVKGYGIVPLRVVDSVSVDGNGNVVFDRGKLLTRSSQAVLDLSLVGAHAVTPWLGVTAAVTFTTARIRYGETTRSEQAVALSVAGSLRGEGAPVGVPFGYRLTAPFTDGASAEHSVEAGVMYSGRRNLDLGVVGVGTVAGDTQQVLAEIRMAYFW